VVSFEQEEQQKYCRQGKGVLRRSSGFLIKKKGTEQKKIIEGRNGEDKLSSPKKGLELQWRNPTAHMPFSTSVQKGPFP